ncbi:E3 ubiquitin-protein ligase RMA1H1-like [Melia azedarach]|uniref:E3 ubiquitin-protein ligase RMA1H1-like n=1 Tax=Melia azedarach TaxID=155640 RepID=A0ACC1WYC9_MELAZ|nr:E3 ubiquitin-protein ligase RMA1H1-like [Melia azedarach]
MAFEQYFAREWKTIAVVTLCGHLYCWPCIYKWLHIQSASLASDEHPQCPVCKDDISHTTMVPLYGRGQTPNECEVEAKLPYRGMAIPPRPAACGNQALLYPTSSSGQQLPYRNPYQNQHYDSQQYGSFDEDSPSPLLNIGGTAMSGLQHPVVGMFGEMVYASVFGNSASLYAYPNSYHSSPRLRRHEMQADKSLNRISIFLFCCFLLCLIVF